MNLTPHDCWDCPVPLTEILGFVGVALLSLWAGLWLFRVPRVWAHSTGVVLWIVSGIATYMLFVVVQRHGINWLGGDPIPGVRHWKLDVLLLSAVLVLATILIVRARKASKNHLAG